MILEIPVTNKRSNFKQRCKFDGVDYELVFAWNSRDYRWYLELLRDGDVVLSSIKVVSNFPLVLPGREQSRFPGMIILVSSPDDDSDPKLSDIGERSTLFYVDEAELTA